MSKYIDLYELMCPDDPVESDDPRREVIMQEMKHVVKATTDEAAVEAVKWWDCWPTPQHQTALDFVKEAREKFKEMR